MSTESESDNSSSSSEDDLPPEISEEFEKSFFNTLSSLKNKDPSIYDKNKKFFDESTTVLPVKLVKKETNESGEKPLFIHDYEQKYLNGNENNFENEGKLKPLPYSVEQKQLKDSFKSFLNDSDDEETDSLLKPAVKDDEVIEKEEADYIQWLKGQKEELDDKNAESNLKKLRDYWNDDNLAEDEAYLKDYILNKRFLDAEDSEEEDDGNLTEESETLEAQENYEEEYNFRFENEDGLIRRFPRTIENSLRRKDNKRVKKRAEVKERKELEKRKKRDEINRQKKIKCKEISDRLAKLKELTGNETLAFNDDDIINDFNPEIHDKKMSEMYNDEFYNAEDGEKPSIDDLQLDDINDDGEYVGKDDNYEGPSDLRSRKKNKKKTRTERKKEQKKKTFSDITDIEKPVYDPKLHESYQKYMEEYYELDCEDFIDDIPCRFKYRQVEPNDYGLSIEEILTADDKELNRWSSIKKISKLRANHVEKNEAKMYKIKGQDEALKMKILPSLYKMEQELENGNDNDEREVVDEQADYTKKKKEKKSNQQNQFGVNKVEDNPLSAGCKMKESEDHPTELNSNTKKSKKKQKRSSHEFNTNDNKQQMMDYTAENGTNNKEMQHTVIASTSQRCFQTTNSTVDNNTKKSQFGESQKRQNFKKNKGNYRGGWFKRKHDFHDSRLSAYGINPKKFRVKEV